MAGQHSLGTGLDASPRPVMIAGSIQAAVVPVFRRTRWAPYAAMVTGFARWSSTHGRHGTSVRTDGDRVLRFEGVRGYLPGMTSVGEDLRRERLREARASSAAERVSAALSLGDLDVEIYACARGIDPATARRRLAGRRRVGRQRSGCVEALRR